MFISMNYPVTLYQKRHEDLPLNINDHHRSILDNESKTLSYDIRKFMHEY